MNQLNNNHRIYGINNCITFLESNNSFTINSIYVCQGSVATKNEKLKLFLNKIDISVSHLDNQIFNKRFSFKHNQGIVIEFSGRIDKNIEDLLINDKECCFVIADQIKDPQNLGQMLRTIECAGVDGIILPRHNSVHVTDTVLQVSQGAFLYADICIENNLVNTIKLLQSNGYWIVGLENSIEAKKWFEIDYKGKIAIVLGSEGKGIRKLVKESCDFLATIPMKGNINSLNVTAALSAILFERNRQLSNH